MVGVDYFSVSVERNRGAASHVGYDDCNIIGLVAVLTEISSHDGPGVERVEESFSGEFGNSSHPALRQHFICHRRVGNVCDAFAETWSEMFFLPDLVDFSCNIIGKDGAQVACMFSVAAALQDFPHVLVYIVDACDDRNNESASGHHDVDVLQRNILGSHEILDCLMAHVGLVHY